MNDLEFKIIQIDLLKEFCKRIDKDLSDKITQLKDVEISTKNLGAAQIFANNQASFLNSVFVSVIIFSHWWLHLTTLRLSIFCAPSLLHRCPACFILF